MQRVPRPPSVTPKDFAFFGTKIINNLLRVIFITQKHRWKKLLQPSHHNISLALIALKFHKKWVLEEKYLQDIKFHVECTEERRRGRKSARDWFIGSKVFTFLSPLPARLRKVVSSENWIEFYIAFCHIFHLMLEAIFWIIRSSGEKERVARVAEVFLHYFSTWNLRFIAKSLNHVRVHDKKKHIFLSFFSLPPPADPRL